MHYTEMTPSTPRDWLIPIFHMLFRKLFVLRLGDSDTAESIERMIVTRFELEIF